MSAAQRVAAAAASFSAFASGITFAVNDPVIPWWVQIAACVLNLALAGVFDKPAVTR